MKSSSVSRCDRLSDTQRLFDAVELVKSAAEKSEGVEAWVLHTENNKSPFPYLEQVAIHHCAFPSLHLYLHLRWHCYEPIVLVWQ